MIVSLFAPHTIRRGDRAGEEVPGFVPTKWETTWPEFVDALRESAAVETPREHKSPPTCRVIALSMAEFDEKTSRRTLEGSVGADWVGLDIDDKDGGGAWRFDTLCAHLDGEGVRYVVYTTTSCTPEHHCLRLLMPFTRRVRAEEWPRVWASYNAWLALAADPQTKDISRLLFEPRRWSGALNLFAASALDLPASDPDEIMAAHPVVIERPVVDSISGTIARQFRSTAVFDGDLHDLDTSPIVPPAALEAALMGRQGGRMFSFLCSVALSSCARRIDIDEHDLVMIGENLARRLGRHTRDIHHDARGAMRFADTRAHDRDVTRAETFRARLASIW